MGVKALVYFELVTTLALFIGLARDQPLAGGRGASQPPEALQPQAPRPPAQSLGDVILHAFPENIAKSVAEGQVLQIVVFGLLFAVALSLLPEEKRRPLLSLAESLAATMFKFTHLVMLFAPIGVGAAIAYTVGHMGLGILVNLAKALATFYLALAAFLLARAAAGRAAGEGPDPGLREGDRRAGHRSPSPPPARRPRCRSRWSAWSSSACRARRSPS